MCSEAINMKIKEKKMTVGEFISKAGIDRTTFYRKMKTGGKKLTLEEISKISEALDLTKEEATSIFFWRYSRINATDYSVLFGDNEKQPRGGKASAVICAISQSDCF